MTRNDTKWFFILAGIGLIGIGILMGLIQYIDRMFGFVIFGIASISIGAAIKEEQPAPGFFENVKEPEGPVSTNTIEYEPAISAGSIIFGLVVMVVLAAALIGYAYYTNTGWSQIVDFLPFLETLPK